MKYRRDCDTGETLDKWYNHAFFSRNLTHGKTCSFLTELLWSCIFTNHFTIKYFKQDKHIWDMTPTHLILTLTMLWQKTYTHLAEFHTLLQMRVHIYRNILISWYIITTNKFQKWDLSIALIHQSISALVESSKNVNLQWYQLSQSGKTSTGLVVVSSAILKT